MKRIVGLTIALFLLNLPGMAADLRVTDSSGVEVLVRSAIIDYGGLLGSDTETEGIRVQQGDAIVTAKWADLESLTVTGRDAAVSRLTVDVVVKGGKKVTGTLVRKGRMKLAGKSDLGDYSIDLEKIKKITAVPER